MASVRIFQAKNAIELAEASLERLPSQPIALERPIQRLCERNLGSMFGLEFLATEFAVQTLRIDTLAFDPTTSAYVIIEYKRGASTSVIDQGFAYLNLLRNHKEAFLYKHSEMAGRHIEPGEIDWRKCRVFFVSQEFTEYQRLAVEYKDFSFELYQIGLHGDSIITLERVGSSDEASIEPGVDVDIATEKARPSIEAHLEGRPAEIRTIYEELRAQILALGEDIIERPIQVAILFESTDGRFAEVIPQQTQVRVHFDHFDGDSRGIFVDDLDARGTGHLWGVGGFKTILRPGEDIEPFVELVRQSYRAAKEGIRE